MQAQPIKKAVIKLEEGAEGELLINFEFEPPLQETTPPSVVATAVSVIMDSLKENATEKPRIIVPS